MTSVPLSLIQFCSNCWASFKNIQALQKMPMDILDLYFKTKVAYCGIFHHLVPIILSFVFLSEKGILLTY